MHSIHLCSFRILKKQKSSKSFCLGELNDDSNKKAYELMKTIFENNVGIPIDYPETKTIVSIPKNPAFTQGSKLNKAELNYDDVNRLIYGYLNVGRYGEKYTVREKSLTSTNTKNIEYNDVEEKKRYILMYLPDSLDTGIIAFHDTERLNAKTCFKKFIESNFQNQSPRLEARVRPLLHKDIPSRIKEADVVEIKAVGFRSSQDDADAMALVGNRLTGEFVIKNNGLSMGSVVDFITRNKPQTDLIELLEEKSDKIKITASVNGQDKVYTLNNILSKGISIALDDSDLNLDQNGFPNMGSLHNAIKNEINDYLSDIYGDGSYSI
ncbi:TPA: hypothetical protein ACKRF0_002218 [Proteus mirabilis]